jgi:hypothetical protein
MDLEGNITKEVNVNENGESEGLAIGMKNNIPFIAVGYNGPNRVYILNNNQTNLIKEFYSDLKLFVKRLL